MLASMAPPLLSADTVPALESIATNALQARDTAAATRQSLSNVSPVVQRAINLWLADPATRSARVEHIVRVDPSAVSLPVVWKHVCSRRTDLLDVAFAGPPPRGKFLADGVSWVPLYAPHARR